MSVGAQPDHDNLSHNHRVALDLASKGIRVFPCRSTDGPPGADGKPQWRAKSPAARMKWKEGATTDIAIINEWWISDPDALVGMPLEPLNLVILDPDQHQDSPDGIAAFEQLAKRFPELLGGPYVQTPQGRHYIYLQPPGMRLGNSQGNLPPGINVRGDGGYVIAPGTVLPDGRGWVLHAHAKPFPLPPTIVGIITQHQSDSEQGYGGEYDLGMTLPDDPRKAAYLKKACRNAFAKIAETPPGNRNNMLNIQAVKLGHFVGAGLLVENEIVTFLAAAARAAGLDAAEIHPTIHSGLAKGKAEPHDPFDVATEFWEDDDDATTTTTTTAKAPALRVWTVQDLWNVPSQPFLIDGLIPANAVGLLVGDTQTFKSFIAQSMAVAVAAGQKSWEGHDIKAPENAITLYIAGEGGPESASKRMRAWASYYGFTKETLKDSFRLITHGIDLLDPKSYRQVVAACRAQLTTNAQLALIVIDTINTAAPGAEENSTKEMGILYSVCRSLGVRFNCAVLGAHHVNKQGGVRGANLLVQNADFQLKLTRDPKALSSMNTVLEVVKLKDAQIGLKENYHLALTALDDGTTSLVPVRIGAIEAQKVETTAIGRPSTKGEAILEFLRRSPDGETKAELCTLLEATTLKEKHAVTVLLGRMRDRDLVTRNKSKWQIVQRDFGEDFLS